MAETLQQGEKLQELLELVDKYKRNKTALLPEDIKGKYAASFKKLKRQILRLSDEYFKKELLRSFVFTKDSVGYAALEAINAYLKEVDYGKGIRDLLFKEYDVDKACRFTDQVHEYIQEYIYVPYWLNYTEEASA